MIYLYGASGHAKVIIEILESNGIQVDALFDDNPAITKLLDYTVIKFDPVLLKAGNLVISIGDNLTRKKIAERFNSNQFGHAIHPSAVLSKRATIGEGTVIMANATINSDAKIGKHVIINTSASIDHDCVIGDYAHISPNATLSGNVTIGEGTWIGAGAVIIPGVKVGKWSIIGAGAVVIRDVPDGVTVVGVPGRVINLNWNE